MPSGKACEHHKSRREGIKQGIFIFLLTFLVAPLVGIIFVFGLRMEPWPVGVVVFLFGVGGLLRIIHALTDARLASLTKAAANSNSPPLMLAA